MAPFKLFALLTLICFFRVAFSQDKQFERFVAIMDSVKAQNRTLILNDSLITKTAYELKWTVIYGTYGGSAYCCGGEIIKATSPADTLLPEVGFDVVFQSTGYPGNSTELIGDRYLVETVTYYEQYPTSNPHYVYVIRYYERKP